MPLARRAPVKTEEYLPPATDAAEDDSVYEDESPIPERKSAVKRGGWDAAEEVHAKAKTGEFFVFSEKPALIAFVEGAPIDSYLVHWVDTKEGRRSFRCLEDQGTCPLDEVGDAPTPKFVFWAVEFSFSGDNVDCSSKILEVGPRLKNTLKEIGEDPRKGGPLEENFFSAHRTGKKQSTQYHVSRIKDRDLAEDWQLDPKEARAELEAVKAKGEPQLFIPDVEDLEMAAAYLRRHG